MLIDVEEGRKRVLLICFSVIAMSRCFRVTG